MRSTTSKVTSKDGTRIEFDKLGEGPAVVLMTGGPVDRMSNMGLAALLAPHFTVYNYDRRGRGGSGDTQPYALEREFEDLDAVIAEAGGSVLLYGSSGGAMLGLEAAAYGLGITKLALWEPPYIVDDSRPPVPADYADQLHELAAAGRRGDMIELFLTKAVGLPAEFVAQMRGAPFWPAMEALAPTLIYDAVLAGDFSLPTGRLAKVTAPALVIDGGEAQWLSNSAQALVKALPNARHRSLKGQPHNVADDAIAPLLIEFLAG